MSPSTQKSTQNQGEIFSPKTQDIAWTRPIVEPVENDNEENLQDPSVYEQWAINEQALSYYLVTNRDWADCVSMIAGQTDGGDLLSTLIVDTATRDKVLLDTYSVDYLKQLEKKIAVKTQERFQQNFYAFFVCHLGEGIDIAAGYQYFIEHNADSKKFDPFFEGKQPTLALVNNDEVTLYQDIRLINNTATGAEVEACSPELLSDAVRWRCFLGLVHDDEGTTGSWLKEWDISLTNGEVTSREYQSFE